MTKSILILFVLITALNLKAQTSAMTYNIRYNNPDDKENWWENRKAEVIDLIDFYSPDILGLQEALLDQTLYLDKELEIYDFIGVGREDGDRKGELAPIFYNTDKVTLVMQNTFWLSDTPDKVSLGWDAALNRIVTMAKFKDNTTKETFFVFNTHFDHKGKLAQENSSKLILKLIDLYCATNEKVIVMGDLNATPDEDPIVVLGTVLQDSFTAPNITPYGPIGTYNAFDTNHPLDKRIDYIFNRNLNVKSYRCIDDRRKNLRFPSDHLPILVRY